MRASASGCLSWQDLRSRLAASTHRADAAEVVPPVDATKFVGILGVPTKTVCGSAVRLFL